MAQIQCWSTLGVVGWVKRGPGYAQVQEQLGCLRFVSYDFFLLLFWVWTGCRVQHT